MKNKRTPLSLNSTYLFAMFGLTMLLQSCATTLPGRTFEQRTIGLYVSGTELYNQGKYIQAIYLLKQARHLW